MRQVEQVAKSEREEATKALSAAAAHKQTLAKLEEVYTHRNTHAYPNKQTHTYTLFSHSHAYHTHATHSRLECVLLRIHRNYRNYPDRCLSSAASSTRNGKRTLRNCRNGNRNCRSMRRSSASRCDTHTHTHTQHHLTNKHTAQNNKHTHTHTRTYAASQDASLKERESALQARLAAYEAQSVEQRTQLTQAEENTARRREQLQEEERALKTREFSVQRALAGAPVCLWCCVCVAAFVCT